MPEEHHIGQWLKANAHVKNKLPELISNIKTIVFPLKLNIEWPKMFKGVVSLLDCIPEQHYEYVIEHLNGMQRTQDLNGTESTLKV